MKRIRTFSGTLALLITLAACAQNDGIDQNGAVFEGIDAQASVTLTGTEPFWGLDIKPADGEGDGYVARFTHPEDIDGSEFPARRFAGNNGLGFSGTLDGKAVTVAITPGECSDGMSDRGYPYTATVKLDDATLFGCAFTSDEPFTDPEVD